MLIITIWVELIQQIDLQADFTTLRPQNYCYWKPLFHWVLDVVLANTYLLAKASRSPQIGESRWYYKYQQFLKALAKALMTYGEALKHNQVLRPSRTPLCPLPERSIILGIKAPTASFWSQYN
jgi:hypothetical protein